MLNITRGVISRPQRVVIYGGEGIGKTTLASKFPDPLFIDTENGTAHLDVKRVGGIDGWNALLGAVREVARTPGVCRTLVIDTADRAERMAIDKVCKEHQIKSIEGANYGRGYVYLAETFDELLKACDAVIASGAHVVIIAHAKMRKFEQPDEMGAYDRWELKLSKQVGPLLKEWCDMLLFLNYKTYVVTTDNGTKKAQGGKRVIYTTHRPTFDAKNRHGLPDELELDYAGIAPIFDGLKPPEPVPTPLETLTAWMDKDGVEESELRELVAKMNWNPENPNAQIEAYPEKLVRNMLKSWAKIVTTINAAKA